MLLRTEQFTSDTAAPSAAMAPPWEVRPLTLFPRKSARRNALEGPLSPLSRFVRWTAPPDTVAALATNEVSTTETLPFPSALTAPPLCRRRCRAPLRCGRSAACSPPVLLVPSASMIRGSSQGGHAHTKEGWRCAHHRCVGLKAALSDDEARGLHSATPAPHTRSIAEGAPSDGQGW